mgnify:CR=1 FL=1|jgi:hypothetical protein
MLPPDPVIEPGLDRAQRAEMLMRAHTDLVARFGLGVAPTFKQTLNRVIAEMDAEGSLTDRPVDSVTDPRKSGL